MTTSEARACINIGMKGFERIDTMRNDYLRAGLAGFPTMSREVVEAMQKANSEAGTMPDYLSEFAAAISRGVRKA